MVAVAPALQGRGMSPSDIACNVMLSFVIGILLVWLYAAMRPRFGPGPKTAIIAGLTIYAAITVILAGFLSVGMFMQDVFIKQAAIALVVNIVASLVGGAIYKET